MSRVLVPLLVLVSFAAGISLGGHPELLPGIVRDALVGDKDTRVVREALDKVADDYYREIPESKLADAALKGVVASLHDRFSNYLTAKEYKRFQDVTHNAYAGVGMEVVAVKRGLRVVQTYAGSPAKAAGIVRGDVVVGVNGASLKGASSGKGSDKIKGPPGTPVTLSVLHAGKVRDIKLERARVTVPVVSARLRTVDGIKLGVVRLSTFSSGAHGEVHRGLQNLLTRGAKGFVFDLRGNGGGLVSEAQLIASEFLEDGTIVTTRGRAVDTQTLKAIGKATVPDLPLVVLVDHDSASASEIVTGALQDRDRATVVGVPTFGKGVFQTILELSNGGALDITAGQYFTPSGQNLGGQGVKTGAGIKPDVRAKDLLKTRPDEALDKALAILAGKVR